MKQDIEAEKIARFMLKTLSPADYTKHHAESVLEHLYQRPEEEDQDVSTR
jgi:hypothetical protein